MSTLIAIGKLFLLGLVILTLSPIILWVGIACGSAGSAPEFPLISLWKWLRAGK